MTSLARRLRFQYDRAHPRGPEFGTKEAENHATARAARAARAAAARAAAWAARAAWAAWAAARAAPLDLIALAEKAVQP
jgi:hypothetical protein